MPVKLELTFTLIDVPEELELTDAERTTFKQSAVEIKKKIFLEEMKKDATDKDYSILQIERKAAEAVKASLLDMASEEGTPLGTEMPAHQFIKMMEKLQFIPQVREAIPAVQEFLCEHCPEKLKCEDFNRNFLNAKNKDGTPLITTPIAETG